MTEAEWLASTDPEAMGKVVLRRKRGTVRVLRLTVAAFWGWYADRLCPKNDRAEMREAVGVLEEWAEVGHEPPNSIAVGYVFLLPDARFGFGITLKVPAGLPGKSRRAATSRAVWSLREVFGNPFPVRKRKSDPHRWSSFDPGWRTDTVLALARQMYESREFSAMPILADALQDAGCDNPDILDHCRGAGPHVRGCWVVDLVLGKE